MPSTQALRSRGQQCLARRHRTAQPVGTILLSGYCEGIMARGAFGRFLEPIPNAMRTNRRPYLLLIGVIAAAVACRKEETAVPTSAPIDAPVDATDWTGHEPEVTDAAKHLAPPVQTGTWKVLRLFSRRVQQPAALMPWIRIQGGELTGFTGCNQINGSVRASGEAIQFSDVSATHKLCPGTAEQEADLVEALQATTGIQVAGSRLFLRSPRGETAMLIRLSDSPRFLSTEAF